MATISQLPPPQVAFKNITPLEKKPGQVLGQNWFVTIKTINPGSASTPEIWEIEGVERKPSQTLYEVNGIIRKLIFDNATQQRSGSLLTVNFIHELSELAMKLKYKKNLLGRFVDAYFSCSSGFIPPPMNEKSNWPATALTITLVTVRKRYTATPTGFLSLAARNEVWNILKRAWKLELPDDKFFSDKSITVTPGDRRMATVVGYLCKIATIVKLFAAVIIHPRIALVRIPEAVLNPPNIAPGGIASRG